MSPNVRETIGGLQRSGTADMDLVGFALWEPVAVDVEREFLAE